MLDKARLIAFTDGILAVAATVMVLRLDIPDKFSFAALAAQWPILLAYIISFIQISLAWHEHHDTFVRVEKVDHRLFLLNCLWLFTITLLPFVTGMVGISPRDRATLWAYLFVLFLQQTILRVESDFAAAHNGVKINDAAIIAILRRVDYAAILTAAVVAVKFPAAALGIVMLGCGVDLVLVCLYDMKKIIPIRNQ